MQSRQASLRSNSAFVVAFATALVAAQLIAVARVDAQQDSPDAGEQALVLAAADSLLATGDSAQALVLLDSAVHRWPRHASAWHRRGMLAWEMTRGYRQAAYIKDRNVIRRLDMADTSLRIAAALAPDSARFTLNLGRFAYDYGGTMRIAAEDFLRKALDVSERQNDSIVAADAADQLGMLFWRRYETAAHRVLGALPDRVVLLDPPRLDDYIGSFVQRLPDDNRPGEPDYRKAVDLFEHAVAVNPVALPPRQHLYMALAEQGRWSELLGASDSALKRAPWDAWAWLGRGLASHRLNRSDDGAAAFDSALSYLAPADRERYTRLSRLLSRSARSDARGLTAEKYDGWSPAERAELNRIYWTLADPLALTPANEHRVEFYARLTFADLRWSVAEMGLRGADTDRGEVYVRYGPPDDILAFKEGSSDVLVVWRYRSGEAFLFRQQPASGTATFHYDLAEDARRIQERVPARWNNIVLAMRVDSIPSQATRFRAGRGTDSLDYVVFAALPVDTLVGGLDVEEAPIDVGFRAYDARARVVASDSSRETVQVSPSDLGTRMRSWRVRLPATAQVWRVEAVQPVSQRAARTIGMIAADTARGLAMSDVLVAASVQPRDGVSAARWSDLLLEPSVGTFARGAPVALVWETYGLTPDEQGRSRYRVGISLEKVRRDGPLGIVARVMSGAGQLVGLTARGSGTVSFEFERTASGGPAAVDYLTLDLGDAPSGEWRATVEVTDQVTGRAARGTRTITIAP